MSKISVYTTCTNAIRDEYFLIEGIKSALLFADEVVVLDCGSTDDTIEQVEAIGDSRIKIYHQDWLPSIGWAMYKIAKSVALGRCTSEWCVLMDADEVFHEKDVDRIRNLPNEAEEDIIAIAFGTYHFYKDYKHLLNGYEGWKDLYEIKVRMVRNGLGIHHGNQGGDIDALLDRHGKPIPDDKIKFVNVPVYHYGHVRSDSAYLRKQNKMHSFYEGKDIKKDSMEWISLEKLSIFNGTHPDVMRIRIAVGTDNHNKIIQLYK